MKKLILIGAGGQAKSCLDVVLLTKKFKVLGFIDKDKKAYLSNYKHLGNEESLQKLKNKSVNLHISLGFITSPDKKIYLFNSLKKFLNATPYTRRKRRKASRKTKKSRRT